MKNMNPGFLVLTACLAGGLSGCGACAAAPVAPEKCADDCSQAGCAGQKCALGCVIDGQCSDDGRCLGTLLPVGTECRPSSGDCDPAETCDGKATACPADALAANGTRCRGLQGQCDVAEVCDGVTTHCPADAFAPSTTPCRPDIGPCDVAEYCSGAAPDCPADAFKDATTICRPSIAACDAPETCDGRNTTCPPDQVASGNLVCRPAAGPCDLEERCDGNNLQCPDDHYAGSSVGCRAAAGDCDRAEVCDGTGADCPVDTLYDGTRICRSAQGLCDEAEVCDGIGVDCPSDKFLSGGICRTSAGVCDLAESCNGQSAVCPTDAFDSSTLCRDAACDCDVAEYCDGARAVCPTDRFVSNSVVCRAGILDCDADEHCPGNGPDCPADVAAPDTAVCRPAAGGCDVAEVCDGVNLVCPVDEVQLPGGICRPSQGNCDIQEVCDGVAPQCPDDVVVVAGTVCRGSNGTCDVTESCDGNPTCPDDTYAQSSVVCRPSTGACDPVENCLGTGTLCPAEIKYTVPPPPVPTAIGSIIGNAPTQVTLRWTSTAVTGTVEHRVEVDDAPDFATVLQTSAWSTVTSWTVTLDPNMFYYWRVVSRVVAYPSCLSATSAVDWFTVSSIAGPPPPVLVPAPDVGDYAGAIAVALSWSAVVAPDADPVAYYVQIDDDPGFGSPNYVTTTWLTTATWTVTVGTNGNGQTWYWRVRARDTAHPYAMSAWSGVDSFIAWEYYWSSCPFIFVATDQGYQYMSDMAGSVIGLPLADPLSQRIQFYGPRYFKIDQPAVDARGRILVKLRETLAEISYLDEIKLVAVDHPTDREVFDSTTENTAFYGYTNPATFYPVAQPRPPLAARDAQGRDVTDALSQVDDVLAPVEPGVDNYFDLDFGPIADPANARLLIDGWNGSRPSASPVEPYIELRDANGEWIVVRHFGQISGDLRTMVIPLSEMANTSSPEIRLHLGIRNKVQTVVDRVRLDDSAPVPIGWSEWPVADADLHYRGAVPHTQPSLRGRGRAVDETTPDNPNAQGRGSFTRYGDVKPLLYQTDDMFVIMRHGDECTLEFESPPLPPDSARTYFLKADFYYKGLRYFGTDADPLPFHGMSLYPYPDTEHYPDDAAHQQYRADYNTRTYP